MTSIDEAIAHAREIADKSSDCWKHCVNDGNCSVCEKEHEQLAEWLEDYKQIKMLIPIEKALKTEYNKAIDDFVNACEKQLTTMFGQRYADMRDIKNIADRLREQK